MLIDRSLVEAALPGYSVEGDLGKGGYGLVLAGQHRLIGRKVAIKILLDTTDDPDLRARFLAEARVLAELDHPHIVRIHDYVEHEGICLLVMELLSGGTLKQRMSAGKLSPETVCATGIAAAAALANAHSRGILHRDVKPDNIMFAGDGLLKVTDFGIAKIFDGAETTASAILGTPRYMAPEQIMGGRLFPATDLYALAGVLYEMFADRPLFGKPMAVQPLTHHHLTVMPQPLTMVPAPISAVIMRCLAKDPAQRFPDANEFALELARAASQSLGPNWLSRSDVKIRVDDEIREAALGTSSTPGSTPRPTGSLPGTGYPAGPAGGFVPPAPGPGMPGPGGPSGPQPAMGGFPAGGARPGGAYPPAAGYSPPAQARPPAPPVGTATPGGPSGPLSGPGWPGYGPPPTGPAGSAVPPPPGPQQPGYRQPAPPAGARPGQPGWQAASMPTARPAAPPPGQQAPRTARPSAGRSSQPFIIAAVVFVVVVALTVTLVAVLSKGESETNGDGGNTLPRPGVAYSGPAVTVDGLAPYGLSIAADGALLISSLETDYVHRVAPDGTVSVVAGTGIAGFSGDGGPAAAAQLNSPGSTVEGSDGSLYIADAQNGRIRKIDPNGIITTVVGTGTAGFSGDGGPATAAQINSTEAVAVGADGSLYIADYENNRIRRIDPNGIITTIAGTGPAGHSGDGGPATAAQINGPNSVKLTDDGTIYIANLGSDTVQRITPDGIITTVAGNGTQGFSGDGGPATAAQLNGPAIDVAPDGTIYIADYNNHRVRRVDPDGTITTIAGTGEEGDGGDGGPATAAQFANPGAVAVDATGAVYVADSGNYRIRRIAPDGTITTVVQ